MTGYSVYDVHRNRDTHFYGGSEWVVDGELGRRTFPGDWDMGKAVEYYRNNWDVPHGIDTTADSLLRLDERGGENHA